MEYSHLITELNAAMEQDPAYVEFQKKILVTKKEIIGVRTPELRKIVKKHRGEYYAFKPFPDDIYEVDFIKVCLAGYLSYGEIVKELPEMIKYMDTWALTDTFSSPETKKNREDFKRYIDRYISDKNDFARRIALVILLKYYVDEENIPYALDCVKGCDCAPYYVSMAAAWLVAEIIIKDYPVGKEFLKGNSIDKPTHNRAIQKCRDSFRLTALQKEELKALKRD